MQWFTAEERRIEEEKARQEELERQEAERMERQKLREEEEARFKDVLVKLNEELEAREVELKNWKLARLKEEQVWLKSQLVLLCIVKLISTYSIIGTYS